MQIATLIILTVLSLATVVTAMPQEVRTLAADTEGVATDVRTGETIALALDLDGDVVVTASGAGVDRTAASRTLLDATLTLGGTTHTIPVRLNGEGTSLVQSGVAADAWRFSFQGGTFASYPDMSGVAIRGVLTLVGVDGGYEATGHGAVTIIDERGDTHTHHLEFAGKATFE